MEQTVTATEAYLSKAGWLRQAVALTALAGLYFLAGKLGLHFALVHASASAVWPPTGIALAAVLLFGRRTWPAIFAGALLVNLTTSGSLVSSLGIAAGNTLEAVVGASLVARHAGGVRAFERSQDFLRFVLFGGLLGTAISATVGATVLVASGEAARAAFGAIWLTWWFGDMAGALIVTPLLVLWIARADLAMLRAQPFEAVLLLAVVVATGALVFAHAELSRHQLAFLCIPPLIWAAFRFGQREVATAVALLSTIATWATVRGVGPFATGDENESLLLLQAFMVTISVLTMPVAALVWERKAIERERWVLFERERVARAEAERASHAKDEFLAMLSHELRNPLAAIGNAAHVLSSPAAPHGSAKRAVEIVQRQTGHLSRLIDDLLDVARVSSGKFLLAHEKLNLGDIVEGCVALARGAGRLDQHELAVDAAPAWVLGDPARLTQVVDNLLTNAIKYTPSGGRIEIRTWSERDEVALRIRDDGAGIAPELLPLVFELFTQGPRTLDRAQGGLGLGLALAQRIVLAHGGKIVANSAGPSQGSTFTVRLPRVDVAEETGRAEDATAVAVPCPRRILIIEDNDDGREALRLQLQVAGHDVFEAANGPQGIELAARVGPDVVLLDIGLPGLDGYQVARQLRTAHGGPRLIAITGYGQPEDLERAREAGIEHYLVKPINAAELARLLQ
ncbi:MAG TPA: MASE1 domain-containing protein [Steroidobacteraceae bacterium]|nr:MASE1 domain-containing protein [Steroidobacteraceae bacterium]